MEKTLSSNNFRIAEVKSKRLAEVASVFQDANAFFAARVMEICFEMLKVLNSPAVDKKYLVSVAQSTLSYVKAIKTQLTSTNINNSQLYEAERDLRWLVASTVNVRNEVSESPASIFSTRVSELVG